MKVSKTVPQVLQQCAIALCAAVNNHLEVEPVQCMYSTAPQAD